MGKDKAKLYILMGYAGSGKSYFVKNLLNKLPIVRLNSDSLRVEMYGPAENHPKGEKIMMKDYIFNALDYATKQILAAGHSVVRDSNHNKFVTRSQLANIAKEHDATPVIIWVKTNKDVAVKRTQERESTDDQRQFSEEKAIEVVERHMANTEAPNKSENVIEINGEIEFDEQYKSFTEQLSRIV